MTMLSVFTLIDLSHIKTAVNENCQSHFLYHSARRFDTGKQATEISIAEQDKKKFRFFFFYKMDKCMCVCVCPTLSASKTADRFSRTSQLRYATENTTKPYE